MNPENDSVLRMSFDTYTHLKKLLEQEAQQLVQNYGIACHFIPPSTKAYISPALEDAHRIFMDEFTKIKEMQRQLHLAAASTYRDHPNKEMREFWGIKE